MMAPGPLPVWPDVTAIHDASLRADHVQPPVVASAIVPVPPLAGTLWLVGVIEVVHPSPCVMVTTRPATRSVPLRVGPVVARASYLTGPLPVPCDPSTIASQSTSLRAFHVHCGLLAVTAIVRRPPSPVTESLRGSTPNVHAAASCVMPICSPPTLIMPLRTAGSALAATLKEIVPSPCPSVDAPSCIQPLAAATLH